MYPTPLSVFQVDVLYRAVFMCEALMHSFMNSQPPKKEKKKEWISQDESFYSIEQTVSIVVIMARVAVTVAGLVIVIF